MQFLNFGVFWMLCHGLGSELACLHITHMHNLFKTAQARSIRLPPSPLATVLSFDARSNIIETAVVGCL